MFQRGKTAAAGKHLRDILAASGWVGPIPSGTELDYSLP